MAKKADGNTPNSNKEEQGSNRKVVVSLGSPSNLGPWVLAENLAPFSELLQGVSRYKLLGVVKTTSSQ